MSFAIFDEQFYLNNYSDVRSAVQVGGFSSGLQHFQQFGLAEGRVLVSPYFDEQLYLHNNPDVAAVVASGGLRSGLQHYIQNGEAEGRSPGTFNEQAYKASYNDVANAVTAEAFSSSLQYYIRVGQFEPNRVGIFSGSTGNDIVTGFGANTNIFGVDIKDPISAPNNRFDFSSQNFGRGEIDTLIGGQGRDVFELGTPTNSLLLRQKFYVGGGNADYAVIKDFQRGRDAISLTGSSPTEYNFQAVSGNLNISTSSGDLVAIVERVSSLSQLPSTSTTPTYALLFG